MAKRSTIKKAIEHHLQFTLAHSNDKNPEAFWKATSLAITNAVRFWRRNLSLLDTPSGYGFG